jgi:hypothetical protein
MNNYSDCQKFFPFIFLSPGGRARVRGDREKLLAINKKKERSV